MPKPSNKLTIMKPIIHPAQLVNLQGKIILIDARAGAGARERYEKEHLKGAFFADLETDLSEKSQDPATGGRHPLPSPAKFAEFLGKTGIDPDSHVVVYDDKNGALAAARFWWMLKALGHEKVQVLDGGMSAAVDAGFPTGAGEEKPDSKAPYPAGAWQLPTRSISAVESAAKDPAFRVIDVREPERYLGYTEPIDLTAGHIPGAVNAPFAANLKADGSFKSPEELRTNYEEITGGRESVNVILHCGSGVTACHSILAMTHAGMEPPALYVGSWSEWSRSGKDIATEK